MTLSAHCSKRILIVSACCTVSAIFIYAFFLRRNEPDKRGIDISEGSSYKLPKAKKSTPSSNSNKASVSSAPAVDAKTSGIEWRSNLTRELNSRHNEDFGDLLRWAESFENVNQYIFLIRKIAANAKKEDCPTLLAWYQSKLSSSKVEAEIAGVVGGVLGNRWNMSDGQIVELCGSKNFGESFFRGLVSQNFLLLTQKLNLIHSSDKRDAFAAVAARAVGDKGDFKEALRVAEIIEGSSKKAEAISNIAFEMTRKDPAEALNWLNENHSLDAEAQGRSAASIARAWFYDDSLAASQWVQSLPAGNTRDQASSAIALSLCRTAPEDAVVWATAIQDENTRQYTLGQIDKYLK
jgi:hypothetical protein